MTHEIVKSFFNSAVQHVVASISQYANNPLKDFIRSRKLPPELLITFLVSQGSSSTKNELADFFDLDASMPTESALIRQRAKLKPEALEAVFKKFNSLVAAASNGAGSGPDLIAADGSTFTFFSKPKFSPDSYFVAEGHSAKGFYSIHTNALYNLKTNLYVDAFLQPIHDKDEYRAFCTMVDRFEAGNGRKAIFIGDRGYCSYNNMAHVINKGQYFLFRTKDIHSKGLAANFDYPNDEAFDVTVKVTLVRSHSRKLPLIEGYRRFIDKATSFDFIEYGSLDVFELSFRVVRFPLSESTYECIVTNLPAGKYPPERIKVYYFARWGIESSFRKLKYTIGLSNFHAYKPESIKQEIWAKLTAYNVTETLVSQTVIEKKQRKHAYKVNFSRASHICRKFLYPVKREKPIDVATLLSRELIPIRDGRQFARLKTAHFRKPKYFIYRAS